ncbi:hypothetical protein HPP92_010171 [Vanilla planifolia]|nr:hypothetical protein HPP92_010171 [Vanilla planifolia]
MRQIAGTDWDGQAVVYSYRTGDVVLLPKEATLPVTLRVMEYELFHISPLKEVAPGIYFAPIGLLKMFNSGGAVEQFQWRATSAATADLSLKVRGCGQFGAYSSRKPSTCTLDSMDVEFSYDDDDGLLLWTFQ